MTSQLGMGAMLHILAGGSENDPAKYIGQKITAAQLIQDGKQEDRLRLTLENGKVIDIWDNGQSCCESRFMTCDDDVQTLVGATLTRIETRDGPEENNGEWGDVHEQVFVEIGTDKGFITIANHNQHNGYYGGFGLTITEAT